MNKRIFFTLMMASIGLTVFSQVNLEAYGSFVRNFNPDFKGNSFGGGVRIEFQGNRAGISKFIGFAYNQGVQTINIVEAHAYSSWTNPSTVNVPTLYNIPSYRLEAGGRFYLTGDADNFEGTNLYLNGSVEIVFCPNKPKYSYYDKEDYSLGYTSGSDVNEDGSEKFGLNFMLAAGAGIEKNIGPGNVFLQTQIAFPAYSPTSGTSSTGIADFAPIPLNVNLGYKIPLTGK